MIRHCHGFRMAILAIATVGTAAPASPCYAQDDPLVGRFPVVTKAPEVPLGLFAVAPPTVDDPAAATMIKLASVKAELAAAKTDEEQLKAKAALQGVLAEIFDQDLKQRRQRIDELNKRLASIQEKFEKRSVAKNNIISLQLKLFIQDGADALDGDRLSVAVPPGNDDLVAKIRELQRARAAENAEETKRALVEASKAMEQYFDTDMDSRKKEMDAIKGRIAGMEKMAQARFAKRDEIIGLRVQLAVNEAQGLGLFGEAPVVDYVAMNGINVPVYTPTVFHNLTPPVPPSVRTTFQPTVVTDPSNSTITYLLNTTGPTPPQPSGANHAIRTGELIVTIEPSEPAVLAINAGSGKIFWKHSLKEAGLSVSGPGQLDLDHGAVVVYKRDGGALKINTETGQVVLEMTPEEVGKRYPVRRQRILKYQEAIPFKYQEVTPPELAK